MNTDTQTLKWLSFFSFSFFLHRHNICLVLTKGSAFITVASSSLQPTWGLAGDVSDPLITTDWLAVLSFLMDWLTVPDSAVETKPLLLLKHYHTLVINTEDSLHTGSLHSHLCPAVFFQPFSTHSTDSIIHCFFCFHLWFGLCLLHQRHTGKEAVSMATCRATRGRRMVGALSQVLTSVRPERGREREKQHSPQTNEYWYQRQSF